MCFTVNLYNNQLMAFDIFSSFLRNLRLRTNKDT